MKSVYLQQEDKMDFWDWFLIAIAVLVVIAIAMNARDIARYLKIRSM